MDAGQAPAAGGAADHPLLHAREQRNVVGRQAEGVDRRRESALGQRDVRERLVHLHHVGALREERRRDQLAALLVELVPDVEIPEVEETEAVQEFR